METQTTVAEQQKVQPLLFQSYMAMVRNAVGSKMFQNFYANVDGEMQDIVKNGELSCAFFASNVLAGFQLIKQGHTTVASTVKDLENSGWYKIDQPREGAVLVWGAITYPDGTGHKHVGFYTGEQRAISNSAAMGTPVEHDWLYRGEPNGTREIEAIYWNDKLEEEKRT